MSTSIMGNSKTLTVQTENGPVVVRKLALGDYAELLRALKKLPSELGKAVEDKNDKDLTTNATLYAMMTDIIADSIPEFCDVLAVATDKDSKFFIEGDLADALEVFAAVLELNDYSRIANTVKKLMARKPADPKLPPKTETPDKTEPEPKPSE